MILGLPAILGLIPLIVYVILTFKGKDIAFVVLLCTVIGALMTGQTPIEFGNTLYNALGSFMALVGFIIMMGAGLGEVLRETKVADTIVSTIIKKVGLKSKKSAMVAVMFTSCLLVALLGTLAGANAIIAPIIIPIVASMGITPSTLSILLHGAGATGLYLGPFTPPVVTYMELTGISYGQFLLNAGIPISIILLVITYINAKKNQKLTGKIESYSAEDIADTKKVTISQQSRKATITFLFTMIALIVYGIISKGGAAYVLTVMLVVSFATGLVGGMGPGKIVSSIVTGGSRMYSLFFMFVLYDPFMGYITESGAFTAIADLLNPIMNQVGSVGFMLISTLIGIFGVSGAAVAQAKVMNDMFLNFVTNMGIPMGLWALVLLVGSQITSFAYPTGDMVAQMGLARSKSLKPMLKNGVMISVATILYIVIRGFIYSYFNV